MTFTKLQLRSLKVYLSWHTQPPTFWVLARSSFRSWLALAVVAGLGYLIVESGYPEAGWLVIGIMSGTFLRDIGRYRVLLKVWPAHDEVTDWERVKSVLEEQNGATKKRGESQRLNSNAGRLSPTSAIGLNHVERSPD